MDELELGAPSTLGLVANASLAKVELRISCRTLPDRDALTKSDPCVQLMMQSLGQWMEVCHLLNLSLVPDNLGLLFYGDLRLMEQLVRCRAMETSMYF